MSSALPQSRLRVQRIAEAAVERARLTVVPRTRVRAPRVPFVTLVSLLLVGGVVGLLMFNTTMQQNSFTVSAMQSQADDLIAEQQALEMRLDHFRDPQRLGVWAREHGLVQPPSPAFLLLNGKVLGTPVPASAEDAFDPRTPVARKPAELETAPIIVEQRPKPDAGHQTRHQAQTGDQTRHQTRDTDRATAQRTR